MLQVIRDKVTGWVAWVFVGLISAVFVLGGISSYLEDDRPAYAAKVNEVEISIYDYQRAYQQQKQRAREVMGNQATLELLESKGFKKNVLDRLVDDEILLQAAIKLGFSVGDQLLAIHIQRIPDFQEEGIFSPERYRNTLITQGMSPAMFEHYMRRSILLNQLRSTINQSVMVTDYDVDELLKIQNQQRSLQYIQLPLADASKDIEVSEEEVSLFYTDNQANYMTPERLKISYLELNVKGLMKQIEAPLENEVQRLYEEQTDFYVKAEQRQARHILIQVAMDAADDAMNEAQTKAQSILDRIYKGEDFAVLAKEFSEDPGSAEQGGDLGFFEKGLMESAFDDAVFTLKAGDVADLVQTSFGFHIIQLIAIAEQETKALSEVRDEVIKGYRRNEAERLFIDQSEQLANLSYENPNTLEVAAEALALSVQMSEWFTRQGGRGVMAEKSIIEAAFSQDVLEASNNSEMIELSDDEVVVLRVAEHEVAAARSLEQVGAMIKASLHRDKARKALRMQGETLVTRVKQGEPLQSLADELGVDLVASGMVARTGGQYDRAIVEQGFKMSSDMNGDALIGGVVLASGDYALVQLLEVKLGEESSAMDANMRMSFKQQIERLYASDEYESLMKSFRSEAEIDLNTNRL